MKYKFKILLFVLLSYFAVMFAQTQSDWTITTLKEYFERRLYDVQLAVNEAKEFSKEKFANTNEWRATLENLGRTYMPRLEQEARDKAQDAQIKENTEAIKKIENMKQGGGVVWAYVLGGGGFIFGIISLIYKKGIK